MCTHHCTVYTTVPCTGLTGNGRVDFQEKTIESQLYEQFIFDLKGQSNEIFYFHFLLFEYAWATDHWIKIFLFSRSYSNFRFKKIESHWEIDSLGYDNWGVLFWQILY